MDGKRVLRHRPRYVWWLFLAAAALTCGVLNVWASTLDRGPFAPNQSVSAAEYVMWALLTAGCLRTAMRRIVMGGEEAVLVGLVRVRRVSWADVAEVELAHRTGNTGPGGRWRVALRMRDGTTRWVPSFVHGGMGLHEGPEFGPGDHGRYGQAYNEAPPHAPRELTRLHRELRAAWLDAGGHPLPLPPRGARARRQRPC
ncbi:hypothetical protein LHJ74_07025 [Streptomyces sp. N2-109]|uniref:PH domain-containing protein n=1 Tax=Streptomyces gossypii TaxID=2883101 RepID=A0ABT2JQN7_9ACTN|nr:hypothetical protein [Streptomyces gossypii]MCT2589675.1 hypothetical protein [Streptomyces gossypii]